MSNYNNFINFTYTDLTNSTSFANTNLSYATFTGAILTNTDLSNSILIGASSGNVSYETTPPLLPINWSLINGYLIGPKANLICAHIVGTSSTSIDITNKRIFAADFTGANLSYVNFSGSSLAKCNFSSANLNNTNFNNCNLENCIFTGATINTNTLFTNSNLTYVISGNVIDSSNNPISTTGNTTATYGTQLPIGWSYNHGYIVGPGAYLFNAKFV
jgi:uncharacterized protein YjbI with pentapeptide repeats